MFVFIDTNPSRFVYILNMKRVVAEVKIKHELGYSGFTLIEVLVAAGLMSLAVLAIADLSQLSTRANRTGLLASDFTELTALIQLTLANPTVCATAFKATGGDNTVIFSGTSPSSLASLNISANPIVTLTADAQTPGLQITNLQLNPPLWTDPSPPAGQKHYLTQLLVQAKLNVSGGAIGSNAYAKLFVVDIYTDLGGKITGCSPTTGQLEQQLCSAMGGTFDAAAAPPCSVPNTLARKSCFQPPSASSFVTGFNNSVSGPSGGLNCSP